MLMHPRFFRVEDFELADGASIDYNATARTTDTSATRNGTFSVQNGQMTVSNTDGEGMWSSEVIDISSLVAVDVSLDIQGTGGLDPDDYIQVLYRVDGGPEQLWLEYYDNFNDNAFENVVIPSVSGNSIQIIIRANNSSSNEKYFWDNPSVSEVPAANG